MNEIQTDRAGLAKLPKGQWIVVRCDGYVFKVFDNWAQVMQSPSGTRDSGVSGHKSRKALVAEMVKFMETVK